MSRINNIEQILEPIDAPVKTDTELRLAAVLIPYFYEKDKILFTKRNENLKQHQGQIAFPGGRFDESDKNLVETCLRETEEEVGINSSKIRLLGRLNPIITNSKHLVYPYVGLVDNSATITINPSEVDLVFCVTLTHLIDQENYFSGNIDGIETNYYQVQDFKIWGVTERILTDLISKMKDSENK